MHISRDLEVMAGLRLENPFREVGAITHCGEAWCSRRHRLAPHAHRGIELVYLVSGSVVWTVEGRPIAQSAGELCLMRAGRVHATAPQPHPEFKALYVGLLLQRLGADGQRLDRALRQSGRVNLGLAPGFEAVLRSLFQYSITPGISSERIPRLFAGLLVAMLEEHLPPSRRTRRRPPAPRVFSLPVQKAVYYLKGQLSRPVPVPELARVAHLACSHFAMRFSREVGLPPSAYHRRVRLEAAREALRSPGASLVHLAQEFGFSSSQHFCLQFHEAFGCTPGKWHRRVCPLDG